MEGDINSLNLLVKLSTKAYLAGVCYDLNDTEGELRVRKMGFMSCDLHVPLK